MAITEVKPVIGYQGTCTIAGATGRFTDLQVSPKTYTMIDVTTTADNGKKTYTKGCYEESISGTLLVDDSNSFGSLKTACEGTNAVQCSFTLGSTGITISGLMHPNFSGPITMSPDDRVTVSFECRPAPTQGSAGA